MNSELYKGQKLTGFIHGKCIVHDHNGAYLNTFDSFSSAKYAIDQEMKSDESESEFIKLKRIYLQQKENIARFDQMLIEITKISLDVKLTNDISDKIVKKMADCRKVLENANHHASLILNKTQ